MKKFNSVLSYIFIIIMAVITLFPFVYMILSSLMTFQEATSLPPTLIPKHFQWENFRLAMEQAPFVRYFFNTILVAGLSTIGTLITSILAAFALVKLEFKFKNVVILCMAALLMVPYEVTVFTNYQTIAQLGLLDTYTALIVPSLASIFYIFYLNGYLTSIPLSYYKAAKIDGCSDRTVKLLGRWVTQNVSKTVSSKIFQEIKTNTSLRQRLNTLLENKRYTK